MRFMVVLLVAAACFGQGKQNLVQTGLVDARGANWIPPTSTFASPPSSPATGSVYVFTDASATGTCSGGGTSLATCRYSGSAWAAVGGGGGGGGTTQISATFDGGGVPLVGTATSCTTVATAGTLDGITLMAFPSGSATVDIRTETWANFVTSGAAGATTIKGSGATPAISSASGATPSTAGFNTALPANSVVCFVLSIPSVSTVVTAILSVH